MSDIISEIRNEPVIGELGAGRGLEHNQFRVKKCKPWK